MNAIELIAAERRRQVDVEGWTPEHDDMHSDGELASAAACYAMPEHERPTTDGVPERWPAEWDPRDFKPTPNDRIRELVKAGALIVAEIERFQRGAP